MASSSNRARVQDWRSSSKFEASCCVHCVHRQTMCVQTEHVCACKAQTRSVTCIRNHKQMSCDWVKPPTHEKPCAVFCDTLVTLKECFSCLAKCKVPKRCHYQYCIHPWCNILHREERTIVCAWTGFFTVTSCTYMHKCTLEQQGSSQSCCGPNWQLSGQVSVLNFQNKRSKGGWG